MQVTYGAMTREPISVPATPFIFRDLKLRGFWLANQMAGGREGFIKVLDRVSALIAKQTFAAECKELALADWKQAFDNPSGKALFVMDK